MKSFGRRDFPGTCFLISLCLAATAFSADTDSPSRLSDQPIPLQTATFPARPAPIVEIGQNPFLGSGYIAPGFVSPTGAVWQPVFIVYGTARSALQTFDSGSGQNTEWANRLDVFGNLYLTPTERILVGMRPLDKFNSTGLFSGYQFHPEKTRGWTNGFNYHLSTLFFEGDFGQLFPKLDPFDRKSLDYGFAIGRQTLNFQDGMMINDTIDSVGITRSSLFLFGSSAAHVTALYGWGNLHRNNNVLEENAHLWLLSSAADYAFGTVQADLAYVNSARASGGDGLYFGAGLTRRFGKINSTIRVNTSEAFQGDNAQVSTGTLVFNQLSYAPVGTLNNLYMDTFWGLRNYASAARAPDAGGPLGDTGLLFAAVGLGRYGAPLGNRANKAVGSALGYQMFFGGKRRQVTVEVGGRDGTDGTGHSIAAAGSRFQQAIGRHLILVLDAFVLEQQNHDHGYGGRTEILCKF